MGKEIFFAVLNPHNVRKELRSYLMQGHQHSVTSEDSRTMKMEDAFRVIKKVLTTKAYNKFLSEAEPLVIAGKIHSEPGVMTGILFTVKMCEEILKWEKGLEFLKEGV